MRGNVIWLAQGFREYRRAFLIEAERELARSRLSFSAAHAHASLHTNQPGELSDTAPSHQLRSLRFRPRGREALFSSFPQHWLSAELVVLPEATGYATGWAILEARRLAGRRTAVFGHGTDFARPGRDDIAERLNLWRMGHVDWWFAYNEQSAEAVIERGMPADRVTRVNNTLDTSGLIAVADELTEADRRRIRCELGLGDGPIGVFIGALYDEKRIDFIIEAAERVRDHHPHFAMVVVGDGPQTSYVEAEASRRPWLRKMPGDTTDHRARYWAIADVATYPAAGGLAINECLSLGVPATICAGFPHGPEASYIEHDVNGIIVPGGDPEQYATAVSALLDDADRHKRLSAGARRTGSALSIEAMASLFCNGVLHALERPTRRAERRASR